MTADSRPRRPLPDDAPDQQAIGGRIARDKHLGGIVIVPQLDGPLPERIQVCPSLALLVAPVE